MARKRDILDCPGLLYGNAAGSIAPGWNRGNVVVDAKRIAEALAWLRRHRAEDIETGIHDAAENSLFISFNAPLSGVLSRG